MTPGQWVDAFLALPGRAAVMMTRLDTIDERTRGILTMNELMRAALDELARGVTEALGDIETLLDRVEAGDTEAVAEIRQRSAQLRNAVPDVTPTPSPTPQQPIPTPDADPDGPTAPTDGGGSAADEPTA